MVVEPAGGVTLDWDVGFNCDRVLRDQLVVQRSVSDTARVNALIGQIQSQRDECSSDTWNPQATNVDHNRFSCFSRQVAVTLPANLTLVSRLRVGSSVVPRTFRIKVGGSYSIRKSSGRDARNNIIVYWHPGSSDPPETLPSDSSKCWLYVSRLGVWSENY